MEEIIPEQGEGEEDWDIVVGNAPLIEGQSIEGGYLWKMGEAHKEWRMRFFHIDLDIARGGRILYFTDASMRQKRGVIELANIESLVVPPAPSGNVSERSGIGYELLLREKPSPHRHHVREWRLKASTTKIRDSWALRLSTIIHQPYVSPGVPYSETEKTAASMDWREAASKRQRIYMEATVTGYTRQHEAKKSGQFTAFEILVHTNASYLFDDNTDFVVFRRYSDFAALSKSLRMYLPHAHPELPYVPSRVYRERFSGGILEERRQAFSTLLRFWIDSEYCPSRLPLPLLLFLSPPSDAAQAAFHTLQVQHASASLKEPVEILAPPCCPAQIPPILNFHDAHSSFDSRLSTLRIWLADHDVDCALGALLVESVGGLVPSRRAAVAKEIALKVRDPQRLFLVQQAIDNAMFT